MAIEKKFVNDGYVKASMDEYFAEQLNRAGYGGMELNRTPPMALRLLSTPKSRNGNRKSREGHQKTYP